ncbi:MAG: hypothetical protein O2780_06845 [Proteobacteria bacterium]|jgi:hypothetical protein|nr:hypothetical protein [Pseudomonadota bacterium]MDA1300958.1 hypothetical protein [Pseudomonadota bacterium]
MAEIADLLLMQQRLRQCKSMSQFGHFVSNDSRRIAPYQTGILWNGLSVHIEAVSGLPEPVVNIPFTDWARRTCLFLATRGEKQSAIVKVEDIEAHLRTQWHEFLPSEVVWVPLTTADATAGGLLLGRDEPWQDAELRILDYWAGAVGHAMYSLCYASRTPPWHWKSLLERRVLLVLGVVVIGLMLMPVSLSVNSRAEVVAKDAMVVRSPITGIIGEVFVQPNESVDSGDQILTFDETSIQAQLDVVNQELAISRAELQRATQASVTDRRVSSELPMLQARVEQNESRFQYNQSLLERSRIFAEHSGIVIIPVKSELEGRPVQTGEKLFTLAEPGQVELEFWLPVGDSIPLPPDAEVELFLNVYPDRIQRATIRFLSYQSEVSPDGILGFRGRAEFSEPDELRVGWRGTAKLYGEQVTLFYFLFRRPLSMLRQTVGL